MLEDKTVKKRERQRELREKEGKIKRMKEVERELKREKQKEITE